MLNPLAPEYTPHVPIFAYDGKPTAVLLETDRDRRAHSFDRAFVADEDLFNPVIFPCSAEDDAELEACEAFVSEMASFEEEEKHQELHFIYQERLSRVQHGTAAPPTAASLAALLRGGGGGSAWKPLPHERRAQLFVSNRAGGNTSAKPNMLRCRNLKQPRA